MFSIGRINIAVRLDDLESTPNLHALAIDFGVIHSREWPEYDAFISEAPVRFTIETEKEADGRWLTEIPELPGVLTYGSSRGEAVARAKALALRVLADRLENGEAVPELTEVFLAAP